VIVQAEPGTALTPERALALREALAGEGIWTTDKCDDDTLFSVDAAVTGVVAAIAETGTVICVSGQSSARGVSLIPPIHVALVAGPQLAGDLFDAFEQLTAWQAWPADVNLITGPSKTADIEGVLVTGMHGPGAVHVLLLEGE
jgi:L-lactate dehydrogenase complex protein LldG